MSLKPIELNYLFHCKPTDLFFMLHHAEALKNWIAEKVEYDLKTAVFTFHWENFSDSAHIVQLDEKKFILVWEWVGQGHQPGEFVRFEVGKRNDEGMTELSIFDACEPDEEEDYVLGWNKMMRRLSRAI